MKKLLTISLVFLATGCVKKLDRDHLDFKDDISIVENSILAIDSLLPRLPEQKNPSRIPSLFYEIENTDTVLYLNAEPVGDIHTISLDSLCVVFQMDIDEVSKLKEASLILLRNDISSILNDYCGWHYVYKISNDRGQYRPLLYNYNDKHIQFKIYSCRYQIIDQKGEIVLFKKKDEPVIPRRVE